MPSNRVLKARVESLIDEREGIARIWTRDHRYMYATRWRAQQAVVAFAASACVMVVLLLVIAVRR